MAGDASAEARRAALVVAVPEARALVDPFRARFLPSALERRLPPHVTLLYPIAAEGGVGAEADVLGVAARVAARHAPFAARLVRVGTFAEHVWLAPEPRHRSGRRERARVEPGRSCGPRPPRLLDALRTFRRPRRSAGGGLQEAARVRRPVSAPWPTRVGDRLQPVPRPFCRAGAVAGEGRA